MRGSLFCLVVGALLAGGCSGLNDNEPSYIKDVAAYKEGSDGIVVYFVLADNDGNMTTADGKVDVKVFEVHDYYSTYGGRSEGVSRLFIGSRDVSKDEFVKTKVGLGAFEHEVILFSIGRIRYSGFYMPPSENRGKVQVTFVTKDGRSLEGEETIFF